MPSKINFLNNYFSNDFFHFTAVIMLSIFPLLFFIGTGAVNASIIILIVIFISEILIKKKLNFLKNYIFYTLIFLWITFLINIIFSIDHLNSLSRGIGFIRFIFFVMLILYYFNINNKNYQKIILYSWLIIFSLTSLDLIFESIYGKNILGFRSYIHGRLAGFFNDELIIGHFYYAFILIILSFIFQIFSNKKFNIIDKKYSLKNFIYFFIFLFLAISFLIGERSNFIKVLIMIFSFTFLIERKFYKFKLILFSLFLFLIILFIKSNDQYNKRFVSLFFNLYAKKSFDTDVHCGHPDTNMFDGTEFPISCNDNDPAKKSLLGKIFSSEHGGHYLTALEVYDNNKIFGVGFKNYFNEVKKKKYKDFFYYKSIDSSTHPHQIHFEFLAELGLFGYFFFIIFIIYHFYKFIKQRKLCDNLSLSGLLFVFTSLLPLLPSGSFFTSHSAAFFWMNFAFMNLNQKEISNYFRN